MPKLIFPENFLWGVATSAYQVEGAAQVDGRKPSIWDTFSHEPGRTADGSTGDVACDHYHLYKEDIAQMKALGLKSYRFSISWSRVMPDGTGAVNQKGLDFYKRLCQELREAGISPIVTLYHWDLPLALYARGGWLNRDIADWFADYARVCYEALGDWAHIWSPLNEPIAIYIGHAHPGLPPGLGSEKAGKQSVHNCLLAHGKAIQAFREYGPDGGEIGCVIDIWKHHPLRDCEEDRKLARSGDENSFRQFVHPILTGDYTDYLKQQMAEQRTTPYIEAGDMRIISEKMDYFGLNVYNRVLDSADPDAAISDRKKREGHDFLTNGAELYPKAIYDAIMMLKRDYDLDIPIIITENGTPDGQNTVDQNGVIQDDERIEYLTGFLSWLYKAMSEGVDVRGYQVWSLIDNFEWGAGFTARLGLLGVDYATQKRSWKKSAYWYQKVIADGGLDGIDCVE